MVVEFKTRGPVLTAAQVAAFEATLQFPLPADYREFLLTQNGGEVDAWWPPEAWGRPTGVSVEAFYSLGDDLPDYASLIDNRATFLDSIPDSWLAIGEDAGGAQICLSLGEEDPGAVWFYDPEREWGPEDPPDPELMLRLTDTFTELLQILEPAPDFDEAERRLKAIDPNYREVKWSGRYLVRARIVARPASGEPPQLGPRPPGEERWDEEIGTNTQEASERILARLPDDEIVLAWTIKDAEAD